MSCCFCKIPDGLEKILLIFYHGFSSCFEVNRASLGSYKVYLFVISMIFTALTVLSVFVFTILSSLSLQKSNPRQKEMKPLRKKQQPGKVHIDLLDLSYFTV